jgi:hypothetical protein
MYPKRDIPPVANLKNIPKMDDIAGWDLIPAGKNVRGQL